MSEIWRPSPARMADANLTSFMKLVNAHEDLRIDSYAQLYDWSIERPGEFWQALVQFADVCADWGAGPALENADHVPAALKPSAQTPGAPWSAPPLPALPLPGTPSPDALLPGARFFPTARLNFAENLLRLRDDRPALIFRNERGLRREISFRQLADEVARIAAGLAAAGVVAGDRVAGFLPNIPEAAIAMLATTSLGAVWTSCSPDFGVTGVLDRFGQVAPKVIFTADGYCYGGKSLDSLHSMSEVLANLPSVECVVVVAYTTAEPRLERLGAAAARATTMDAFGTPHATLEFKRLPFDHPLLILYSSGTTGAPKCIVHGAGGTLLQHQKEHLLHTDLKRSDRMFYFTTCGWMMWNWLISGLASGATVVLYDGSPFYPDAGGLWRLAEQERVSILGVSAKYLSALEKNDFAPVREVDLSALRTILSTGSPLPPSGFDYVYRAVKSDVQLASISGGTDIVSCFVLGCPLLPVHRGEIQCRGLGMAVEVFDETGKPVRGQQGELVCTAPFPSMPIGFWSDPDGARYKAAYFERFPGVWHHGDYAALTEHDGIVIYGRSDAVLNPGGVRIGTAEIYEAVESLPEIIESVAVGQDWRNDVRIVLFVRLRPGVDLTPALKSRIRETIRSQMTSRHVPAKIIAVPDIPRTRSGKLTELTVRDTVRGRPIKNLDALANPAALEHFRNLAELDF